MKEPDKPKDEEARLRSLSDLEILDTPSEERFDRITRLARKTLGADIALVSLVDADRQWFKSAQGLRAQETARAISFCGHAILADDAFLVPDAAADERFADNPLVTDGPNIRFYAGQPIHAPDGQRIGTLCVIDSEPRHLDSEEVMALEDLGMLVEGEFRVRAMSDAERQLRARLSDAERRASVDGLTRLWNRDTILKLLDAELDRTSRNGASLGVAMIDIDHFKQVNDRYGHTAGDEVLAQVAERLRGAIRPYDALGRYGGEEFLALITEADAKNAEIVGERMRSRVAFAPISFEKELLNVTVSVGVCARRVSKIAEAQAMIAAADKALYAAKHDGRDRVKVCGG